MAGVLTEAWRDLRQRQAEFALECEEAQRVEEKIRSAFGGKKVRLQLRQERCRFSTRISTLVSKGGMLEAKFGRGDAWQGDVDANEGSVFLDKDGTSLELVLNMLRGYPVPKCLTAEQREVFMHDLEYFALELPKEIRMSDEDWTLTPTPNATLSEDKLTLVKHAGGNHWSCATIGSVGWASGVHIWTVLLVANCMCFMIGVTTDALMGASFDNCGFYVHTLDTSAA